MPQKFPCVLWLKARPQPNKNIDLSPDPVLIFSETEEYWVGIEIKHLRNRNQSIYFKSLFEEHCDES